MKTQLLISLLVSLTVSSAQAAVSNIVMIQGTVTSFDTKSVRLKVANAALVVPRKRVVGGEDAVRPDATVRAELPFEEIRYDSAARRKQKS